MSVSDFLNALDGGIKVTIKETDSVTGLPKELITIVSVNSVSTQLSSELLTRTIDLILIYGKTSLCLHLSAGT